MPRIREARTDDRSDIVDLHMSAIRKRGSEAYDDAVVEAWAQPGSNPDGPPVHDPDQYVIVAEEPEDGTILGFGQLNHADAEVVAVYVHPDHDRNGVGSVILEELVAAARSRGLESVSLLSSLNAAGFYEQAGFEQVRKTTHETSENVEMDAIEFRKDLR